MSDVCTRSPCRWSGPTAALSLLLMAACGQPGDTTGDSSSSPQSAACAIEFVEMAAAAGIEFQHFSSVRAALLPEDNGSGLVFGDYDNDGYDDLYIVNLAGPVMMKRDELRATRQAGRLYRNRGDGSFEDVTVASGLEHVGWDQAAVWADVDGDGWLDLIITGIDEISLFANRGDGSFEDRSAAAGLGERDCLATGPSVTDFDRDGDLDLYVPCYVDFPWERLAERPIVGGRPATMTTPADYPPQANLLFENDGSGRFTDIASTAGVADETGRGLQAAFVDFDDDGWPDLYVANDQSFDRLFHNQGDGTFTDVAPEAGTRDPRAGMGIGIGDYDGDRVLDIFLTHWVGEDNALYRNLSEPGSILFEDLTVEQGLAPVDSAWVGWGTGFFDFDLDADLDLLVVNGSTIEDEWTLEVLTEPKMIPQRMVIYEHQGSTYADRSDCAGPIFADKIVGRGSSFADFDRDGRIDVAVSVHNGRPLLLHNTTTTEGHWLGLQLLGSGLNRWAVGSRVVVRIGERELVRQLLIGEGYGGSNSLTLHFGVGAAPQIDEIEVRWPNGDVARHGPIQVDRIIRIRQQTGGWDELPAGRETPAPWAD